MSRENPRPVPPAFDDLRHLRQHTPGGWWLLNPGSVSIPKEGSWHGYMTMEDGLFLWKDLDGTEKLYHLIIH